MVYFPSNAPKSLRIISFVQKQVKQPWPISIIEHHPNHDINKEKQSTTKQRAYLFDILQASVNCKMIANLQPYLCDILSIFARLRQCTIGWYQYLLWPGKWRYWDIYCYSNIQSLLCLFSGNVFMHCPIWYQPHATNTQHCVKINSGVWFNRVGHLTYSIYRHLWYLLLDTNIVL